MIAFTFRLMEFEGEWGPRKKEKRSREKQDDRHREMHLWLLTAGPALLLAPAPHAAAPAMRAAQPTMQLRDRYDLDRRGYGGGLTRYREPYYPERGYRNGRRSLGGIASATTTTPFRRRAFGSYDDFGPSDSYGNYGLAPYSRGQGGFYRGRNSRRGDYYGRGFDDYYDPDTEGSLNTLMVTRVAWFGWAWLGLAWLFLASLFGFA
jgi:hypothetical protein